MFDKIFKIAIIVLATAGLFLVWLSIDNSDPDEDDVVSINYECKNLNTYDYVPKEAREACKEKGFDK